MASNKTRLAYYDASTGTPHQIGMVYEFDIYQDAIDFAETFSNNLASSTTSYTWVIYLYSYDNVSYNYQKVGDEVIKSVITFPNLVV
jgi:hypothetical protein